MNLEGKTKFYNEASQITMIYRGSFAIVRSAVNKKTGERVAIKIIARYKIYKFTSYFQNTE